LKNKRTTVKDVAQAAGVSLMTVSRAINNRDGISDETRSRVLDLSRKMNYIPSQIARSLATHQTTTLGLVVPDVSNPFFAQIARGAEDAAFENDYSIFLLNSAESADRERSALDSLWQKEVNGVILCSSRLPQDELQVYFDRFPYMVLVNRELEKNQPNIATINIDDRNGAETAVRHLIETGRRHIAFIAGPVTSISGKRRLDGYRAGLSSLSALTRTNWVEYCPPTVQGGYDAILQLLSSHPDLDAVLSFNDLVAVGVLQALQENNKGIPRDVAVIGADDIPLASLVQPMLSTLHVNQYDIGRSTINLLLEMFGDNPSPAKSIIIQPELVIRESG
jgi:LacI family transcriptional regulator